MIYDLLIALENSHIDHFTGLLYDSGVKFEYGVFTKELNYKKGVKDICCKGIELENSAPMILLSNYCTKKSNRKW